MRLKLMLGMVFLAACGARHGSAAPPPAMAVVPCPVSVPAADSLEWKLVQATGFTFCVPPGWRASGARGWLGDGMGVEWGTSGQRESLYFSRRQFPVGNKGPDPQPRRVVEMIGGESAELWDGRVQDAEYTFAEWAGRHVYFEGKASGPRGAEVELMIYRTVRFNASDLGK